MPAVTGTDLKLLDPKCSLSCFCWCGEKDVSTSPSRTKELVSASATSYPASTCSASASMVSSIDCSSCVSETPECWSTMETIA